MTDLESNVHSSQPFETRPAEPTGGGCSKPAWIGCALVVLLLAAAALVFIVKAKNLFGWVLAEMEQQIVTALPAEVTEADRERLSRAFAAATEAVKDGSADPLALQALQPLLMETARRAPEGLSAEEVADLTAALEAVAGIESENQSFEAIPEDAVPAPLEEGAEEDELENSITPPPAEAAPISI